MEDISTKSQQILEKYIKNESLRKHCYAVESAMRFYARLLNEDENLWAAAGLLHDIDYEMYPDTHPNTAVPILQEAGFDKDFIDAILGHAYPVRTDVPRETKLAKYLYACDEITGFVNAYSLMKPDGFESINPKSVIKRMKDKAFARNVNRDDIRKGAEELGIDLADHIQNIVLAMKSDPRVNKR